MTTDKLETGGPAYPLPCEDDRDCYDRANSGYGGMTTRTYAAIHLGVPQSEHEWINDMIRERQRNELAKAAMQVIGEYDDSEVKSVQHIVKISFRWADAMLADQHKRNT